MLAGICILAGKDELKRLRLHSKNMKSRKRMGRYWAIKHYLSGCCYCKHEFLSHIITRSDILGYRGGAERLGA